MTGVLLKGLADLERKLTGGREDECLRALLCPIEAFEDGQRERCGLSSARLCEPDDIAAGKEMGDRGCLDSRRRLVSSGAQRLEDGLT